MSSVVRFIFIAVLALFVHVQVSANSSLRFWEDPYFQGGGVECPFEYSKCYWIDMRGFEKASSLQFYNADLLKNGFSIILYTGPDCAGDFFRWSGTVGWTRSEYFSSLGGLNDLVRSFKVEDYETSTKFGRCDHPADRTLNTCNRI
ncbi:hypothetical protein BG011_000837 [Mortierella polycephala]|uniref:Uncharacterized protein n=1 Tax=Mortierella polycephala TaxID=41804 RepID=A0A9P6PLG3_9FUNG|nr:hypothetical protein BG011_000837 [Mortierella polycephala]